MTDALASGVCLCGNRMFKQVTVVFFDPDEATFADESGRHKRLASRIEKVYECMNCTAVYICDHRTEEWRRAGS